MTRKRAYAFTWNNYPDDYQLTLAALDCRYIVAGEEIAPITGTPHIQGYVYFASAKTLSAVRALLPGTHLTATCGTHRANDSYCRKTRDGDIPNEVVYARGTLPLDPVDRGDLEKARYQLAWDLAKNGDIENIDPDLRLRHYTTIVKIGRDYMPAVERLQAPCGVWIHGLSGCGKTRSVLDAYPDAYPKPRNTWWDGYQSEPIVLLDDVDKFDVRLGGPLKHWADAYPFIAEIKGSSRKIRPIRFIVTSQYTINDIWLDAETREALNRRFTSVEKLLGQNIILLN